MDEGDRAGSFDHTYGDPMDELASDSGSGGIFDTNWNDEPEARHQSPPPSPPPAAKKRLLQSGDDEPAQKRQKQQQQQSSSSAQKSRGSGRQLKPNQKYADGHRDEGDEMDGNEKEPGDEFIDDSGAQDTWKNPDGSDSEHSTNERDEPPPEAIEVRSKRKKQKKSAERLQQEAQQVVDDMKRAAMNDRVEYGTRPAIHKLTALNSIVERTRSKDLQPILLESGVLKQIREWLSALPDGSLPNVQIRTALLELLAQLPCETEQLKDSRVGQKVMWLFKHPDETTKNKKLCRRVIEKWSRPLFKRSADYRDITKHAEEKRERLQSDDQQIRRRAPTESERSRPSVEAALDEQQREPKPGDADFQWHARIPHKPNYNFSIPPKSKVDTEVKRGRSYGTKEKTFLAQCAKLKKK